MNQNKPYKLVFTALRDGVRATTYLDAEDDLDAIDQAITRITRRAAEGLDGDHVLTGPDGRGINISAAMAAR